MAVRRERPIREILEELKGMAKELWLNKWVKWVQNIVAKYRVEDIAEPFGFTEINTKNVTKLLEEYCLDLTESECYRRIEELVKPYGLREEEKAERMVEKAKVIEKELKEREKLAKEKPELLYGLEEISEEIERIRKGLVPNGARAYQIVKEYGTKKGLPPEEVEVIGEEVKRSVEEALAKLKPKAIRLNVATMRLYGVKLQKSRFLAPVDTLASLKAWCDRYRFKFVYDYVIAKNLLHINIVYYERPVRECEFEYDGVNWKLIRCNVDVVGYTINDKEKLLFAYEYEGWE